MGSGRIENFRVVEPGLKGDENCPSKKLGKRIIWLLDPREGKGDPGVSIHPFEMAFSLNPEELASLPSRAT